MQLRGRLRNIGHWAIAWAAYFYYGRPGRKLIVIGVTGTKGKSTTCRLIANILEAASHRVGLLTSVEFQIGQKRWPNETKITMQGRGAIQKLLRDMVAAGCTHAVIETSSQGILQHRHRGVCYDVAIFTNLAPEHVEAHGSLANLRAAKGQLFTALSRSPRKIINGEKIIKSSVVNADDAESSFFMNFTADKKIIFTCRDAQELSGATEQVQAKAVQLFAQGSVFTVDSQLYEVGLPGYFNVYNALAALSAACALKISASAVQAGLKASNFIAGRMEFVREAEPFGFSVVIDYAHEPLSYAQVLGALHTLAHGRGGRLVAVIGGDGGGRDKGKRARMGEIAGQLADIVIVTDVDFYDEPVEEIAAMVAEGARQAGKIDGRDLFIGSPREAGIARALALAQAGDVIAVLGKGSETFIAAARGEKIPWNDTQAVRRLLSSLDK